MRRLLFTAALLLSGAAVARAADDAPALKGDLAKFQGTWSAKLGPEMNIPVVLTFKNKAVVLKLTLGEAGEIELPGEVKIDETAKPNKTVDWINFKNPNGEAAPDNHGIYEFTDADTVRFCSGGPGNERPTEFKGGEDNGPPNLITLKRQKDEPKPKDEPLTGDLLKMQGDWTALVGPEKKTSVALTVKGRQVELGFTDPEGQERKMKGEIVVNETAKPKAIDWVKFARPNGGDAASVLSIYTLSGDEFTVCSSPPGGERPTEFKAGEGGQPHLFAFTRKK